MGVQCIKGHRRTTDARSANTIRGSVVCRLTRVSGTIRRSTARVWSATPEDSIAGNTYHGSAAIGKGALRVTVRAGIADRSMRKCSAVRLQCADATRVRTGYNPNARPPR